MAEDTAPSKTPIYVSFLTFNNLLDWLRELKTIPSQFDRSFWGDRYSGSTGLQLMSGLRFLGLLEGDVPQDGLETLAMATNEERKVLLAQLLRERYGESVVDGLPRMTPAMLNKALTDLGTTDATHRKAFSFFVNAVKAVDLPLPVNIAKQARNKPAPAKPGVRSRTRVGAGNGTKDGGTANAPTLNPPTLPVVTLPTGLHPALVPILEDLPKVASSWSREGRKRWEDTFLAVLTYAYPTTEPPAEGQ
jgi:hypothetical protein